MTLPKANTIHSNCTDLVFDSTYTKETLKGTLDHEFLASDEPLSAFRCVYEFRNPMAAAYFEIRAVEDTLLYLILILCTTASDH